MHKDSLGTVRYIESIPAPQFLPVRQRVLPKQVPVDVHILVSVTEAPSEGVLDLYASLKSLVERGRRSGSRIVD